VPLIVRFDSDKAAVRTTTLILKANSDDVRYIPIEIKSIERSIIEPSTAYLDFATAVFDTIVQSIPIVRKSLSPSVFYRFMQKQIKISFSR
jgi:hypothetical protein